MVEAGYDAAGEDDGDNIGVEWERQRQRERLGCRALINGFMSRSAVSSDAKSEGEWSGSSYRYYTDRAGASGSLYCAGPNETNVWPYQVCLVWFREPR